MGNGKKLLEEKLNKKEFQKRIDEMHAYDIAEDLLELTLEERDILYHYLTNEQIAEIITYLDPEDAAEILEEFDKERQTEIFDEMTVDDVVDILQEYEDEELRDEIIETLEEVEDVKEFIKYDDHLVGAYMSNEYVYIYPNMDVKEATTSMIKQAGEAESINLLFVIDEADNYLGAVNFKTLVKARSPKLIEEIMITIPTVEDELPITEAVYDMKNYELYELPVVNSENKLIGILTLDDAIDAAAEEAEEDFAKLAALPTSDTQQPWIKTAIQRLPWLIVLMVLFIPLMSFSELMIAGLGGIAILAFFQPLMLSSPGNVSTQTLAVALKAIANEGGMKKKDVFKEFISSLITACFLGAITFIISFLFVYILGLGLPEGASELGRLETAVIFAVIIGGSLTIIVSAVSLLAMGIPHLLKKLKIDPAIASGPFITTLIDLFATFVYFGLATLILKGVGLI
jgi:magnesium transporter